MKNAILRTVVKLSAVLVTLFSVSAVQAILLPPRIGCHSKKTSCISSLTIFGADLTSRMSGSPAFAAVDNFTDAKTPRNVTWKDLAMKGTIGGTGVITATLDPRHSSTGTILSTGKTEFPAIATMRFFFTMKAGGLALVSDSPAVFRGTIHAVPPAPRDVLTLISGPVAFHPEGVPGLAIATLQKSTVSFGERPASTEVTPNLTTWISLGLAVLLLALGALYLRRRSGTVVAWSVQENLAGRQPLRQG